MAFLEFLIGIFINLDQYLQIIIETYGIWVYIILFGIIFLESGIVITPLLPGDSLLFTAGTFAAAGLLDIKAVLFLLSAAAIIGDSTNYRIGRFMGERLLQNTKLIKKEYLERTGHFYEKHGNQTIVIARFIPIVRTFAPFLAGIAKMSYTQFLRYNIFGGVLWVCTYTLGGFFFGNLPVIRDNFSWVILTILLMTFVPILPKAIEKKIRHHQEKLRKEQEDKESLERMNTLEEKK